MAEIKQPKIRFKGHTNDWEQRKLGEVVNNIATGRSKFTKNDNFSENGYEILGSTGVIGYDSEYDHNGDFLLTARVGANAGSLYTHKGKVKITDNTVFIESDNISFLYNILEKFDLKRLSFGTGQPLIKASELKKLDLYFPVDEEQEKIGEFFKTLDDTIALHQQKLEVTKQFKQTMLKKMFPKNGETTPEIRFKGFTDDWEDEKFLDICSVKKGTQLNKDTLSKEKTETYKYPVYNGSVNPIGYTTESNKEKGLIMTEGGDVGRVLFSETPFWSSGHSYNITSVDNNIYYLQYLFESNYRKINSKGLGVTIKNLSLSSLKQIILTVNSSYQEQELIGNYFKELDNQINALDKKLETYKEFKKAMLQKMFI